MLLNVTEAAALSWPETVLICVREFSLWYLVFRAILIVHVGPADCRRGSAKFD